MNSRNLKSNNVTVYPKLDHDNKTDFISKIKDTFANLDATQMFENVTDEDLVDAHSFMVNGDTDYKENFSDSLVQQTQSCTTNFYICLVIIGIIVLYLLSTEKKNYTEYS